MDLVPNRSHTKAYELTVGTGEALALAQARRGFVPAKKTCARYQIASLGLLRIGGGDTEASTALVVGALCCGRRTAFQHCQFVNIKERAGGNEEWNDVAQTRF